MTKAITNILAWTLACTVCFTPLAHSFPIRFNKISSIRSTIGTYQDANKQISTPKKTSATVLKAHDEECSNSDIWTFAGDVAAKNLPLVPSADLSPEDVITSIIRGLQFNDVPHENSGLERCYAFMDLPCIKLVTGYGNVPEERTLDKFLGYAAQSPKLKPFIGANHVVFGPLSKIPGTNTRGEIATMPIKVRASFSPTKHESGMVRKTGPIEKGPEQTFMIRLQKQRRPPLAGAYIVTDVIDVASVASISRPLNLE
mmetsp:Transcript_21502/g.33137  ORF Transcript_21502/g.33137 Transcript_21502/m.33137 type:complete len:257 (-) Transcript_21502:58-828(-)|eukprot:CAMPEP_0195308994 /NCGR_PEP_ID=MMETSP0707-20130614/38517_1 /TAXON_ID=33640 /ORGANISM="Asterionellopsis glacialis, Strain CCMP134" /LENGTH=256 /DNA_ID=CAMNT_0040373289 /DNA_START=1138 /DNA_END=1908 /DNA_ORIENTATION=-